MKIGTSISLGEVRRYDGSGNNQEHSDWGAKDTVFLRSVEPAYADGADKPSGPDRPNPRHISNQINNHPGRALDPRSLSGMVWGWGQFLDHDITFTPNSGQMDWNIAVPAGDRHFDRDNTGTQIIPFSRSTPAEGHEVRQQYNAVTAWIDASMVYGSDEERANALRTGQGGRLKTGDKEFLPYNTMGLDNDNPMRKPEESLMVAGDVRANENLGLLSLHVLFVREHNRLCEGFAQEEPSRTDEELYQMARKVVGAQVQQITYAEFLPALLGEDALTAYQGYQPDVDPRISNLFATAAYRMGHSQLEPLIWREGADGRPIPERDIPLLHAFFNPSRLNEGGIAPLLRGMASFIQEPTDEKISMALRNMLFGRPGRGGMDLASINIQRGRDHGLPDFNTIREAFGFQAYSDFSELTSDPDLAGRLTEVFGSPDHLDPWIGFLCEPHVEGAAVGPTLHRVLADQFERLRDGDRFWFENDPDLKPMVDEIKSTSLMDIIRRNTEIDQELDDTPFFGHKSGRRISEVS